MAFETLVFSLEALSPPHGNQSPERARTKIEMKQRMSDGFQLTSKDQLEVGPFMIKILGNQHID